jgi:glycosyltransferase involved in cell wall biosynthesis
MLFLCEHESQGLAYQEALATDVPLLAWDQGWCLDPNRFAWGQPHIPATSVPYFDRRCGLTFRGIDQFSQKLTEFFDLSVSGTFAPRSYVTERLSLEICSARFLDFLEKAQFAPRSRAEAHSAA